MAKNLCILWILFLSQANQKNFQWTSFIALSALPACRMCQMQALKPQNRWGMTSISAEANITKFADGPHGLRL